MPRVPITVLGYRCERCGHEWIPRPVNREPMICPKCKSAYWNRPRKGPTSYAEFRDAVKHVLLKAERPLTWTEIRTATGLPQLFPNNQWVRRMQDEIHLQRIREKQGTVLWLLNRKGK